VPRKLAVPTTRVVAIDAIVVTALFAKEAQYSHDASI
jgi:hypothetical protein